MKHSFNLNSKYIPVPVPEQVPDQCLWQVKVTLPVILLIPLSCPSPRYYRKNAILYELRSPNPISRMIFSLLLLPSKLT